MPAERIWRTKRFLRISLRSIVLAIAIFASFAGAQVKKPEPAAVKPPFAKSLQAFVVTTRNWTSVAGTGRLFERKGINAEWRANGDAFPIVVGRSGMAWGDYEIAPRAAVKYKKMDDGAAPAGLFPLTAAFGSATKPEAVELPYTRLDRHTECVDDADSNFYNRIVNRMQVGNFDWKSSEKLLAGGEQYDLGVFVAYNSYPVEKGRGSCIFLYVWKDGASGTTGGTAMERRNLERIAAWASPDKNPYLVQMPESEYNLKRKAWKLPKIK